jgi:hypothetical protein
MISFRVIFLRLYEVWLVIQQGYIVHTYVVNSVGITGVIHVASPMTGAQDSVEV